MDQVSIYNKWVPQWIKLPLLILAMFPHLMLMSLFHANITFSASFLGVEQEDIQYLLSLMYGAVVVGLLIFPRLFSYFNFKSFILLMCGISILILFLITLTNDFNIIMFLRIIEGVFGVFEGACFLPIIIRELKSKHAKVIGYLILYTIMLTGGTLTTSILKSTIMDYGWNEMLYIILYFHVLVLIIVLFLFNYNRLGKKIPLYQLDLTSCFLLMVAMHTGAFVIIYGRKFYWFSNAYITIALLVCIVFSLLFYLRQRFAKRPVFYFSVLKYKNIGIGVILFFFFYLIRSGITNVYATMSKVWNWPWDYIAEVQYFNVVGTVLGIFCTGVLMIRGVKSKFIFGFGFIFLSISCIWFRFIFYPDTTLMTIGLPLFFQGFSQGWLFTPLVMFLINGMPSDLSNNASLAGTSIRFWTTNIGFAVVQNFTYILNQKHTVNFLNKIEVTNNIASTYYNNLVNKFSIGNSSENAMKLATMNFNKLIQNQAFLLTNMELFTAYSILSIIVAILIFLYSPSKTILNKFK